MTPKIKNPFIITGYVSPEYFCDRVVEAKQLISAIHNGRNTALISLRRMGKTGLIEHCFNMPEIDKEYHTFFIDIYATGSLREFVFLLGKHIFDTLKPKGQKFIDKFAAVISSLRPALKFDATTGYPVFDIGLGEIQQPEVSLEQIFTYLEQADRRCVVAIDEFQQIAKYPEKNIEAILRTHIQRCKNTNFIFAGSQQHMMRDIFFTASRPFYQSVSLMELEPIQRDEYADFAYRFFHKANVGITPQYITAVYDLLEGHTWYMQNVFNELYSNSSSGETINENDLRFAFRNVIYSFEPIYRGMMSNLPERQKETLIAIAKEGMAMEVTSSGFIRKHGLLSASSVQSSVKQLIARELISKIDSSYMVSDRFFGLWIMGEYGAGFHIPAEIL